jgi:hypothetical protein
VSLEFTVGPEIAAVNQAGATLLVTSLEVAIPTGRTSRCSASPCRRTGTDQPVRDGDHERHQPRHRHRCRRPGAGGWKERRHDRHAVHPHLPHAPHPWARADGVRSGLPDRDRARCRLPGYPRRLRLPRSLIQPLRHDHRRDEDERAGGACRRSLAAPEATWVLDARFVLSFACAPAMTPGGHHVHIITHRIGLRLGHEDLPVGRRLDQTNEQLGHDLDQVLRAHHGWAGKLQATVVASSRSCPLPRSITQPRSSIAARSLQDLRPKTQAPRWESPLCGARTPSPTSCDRPNRLKLSSPFSMI